MKIVKVKMKISKYGLDGEDIKKLIQYMLDNGFNTIETVYADAYDLGMNKEFYKVDDCEEFGKEILRNNNNFIELKNGIVELTHICNKISKNYINAYLRNRKWRQKKMNFKNLFKKNEKNENIMATTVPAKHTYKVIGISGTGDTCQKTVKASNSDEARKKVMKSHFTEARGYLRDDEKDYSLSFKGIISVVRI